MYKVGLNEKDMQQLRSKENIIIVDIVKNVFILNLTRQERSYQLVEMS